MPMCVHYSLFLTALLMPCCSICAFLSNCKGVSFAVIILVRISLAAYCFKFVCHGSSTNKQTLWVDIRMLLYIETNTFHFEKKKKNLGSACVSFNYRFIIVHMVCSHSCLNVRDFPLWCGSATVHCVPLACFC
uniref:Secreted protein n=1 Tax=Rhipicephalus zambeziensis TaxID=60191 RepID=A0A224YFI2_9ACAR